MQLSVQNVCRFLVGNSLSVGWGKRHFDALFFSCENGNKTCSMYSILGDDWPYCVILDCKSFLSNIT